LLDAAEAYHREVSRLAGGVPDEVRNLLPRLRDPAFTRVLIATLPEATPVHEAAQLQEDLRRAGIEPYAWILNQRLADCDTRDPLLMARGFQEETYVREVMDDLAGRVFAVNWAAREPVGVDGLRGLVQKESPLHA
jgi:arsenite-transporting ATPase